MSDSLAPETLERLRLRLVSDEGVVLHAYTDSLGYTSIGAGRMIDARKGGGISYAEALQLLDNDITRIAGDLTERWPRFLKLDAVRQVVLISMAYQLGVDGLASFTDTLSAVWRGDYRAASEHMLRSTWSQQTPARAYRLANMMSSGNWPL